jgi:WD40 repeat protein
MNKRNIITLLFLIHISVAFGQKHLDDHLIAKGNISAISAIEGSQDALFAKNSKVFRWSQSAEKISDSIDFQTSDKIIALDYSSNAELLAAGFQSGELFISSLTGKIERLQMKEGAIISVKFSNDGNFLAVGTDDNNLSVWDITNRQLLWSKKGHNDHILSISFSPNDSLVFSGSADRRIGIWNRQTGMVSGYLTESGSWIRKLAVSNAKGMLYAATDEGTIYSWKINRTNVVFSGKKKESLSWALALAAGEDGTYAAGFKSGSLIFKTNFGYYRTSFCQPVVGIVMITKNEFVSFYVSIFGKGLYFVGLDDKAFKMSSK